MSLLTDLFGYLSILVHGLTIVAQSTMIGGIAFLVLLARPLAQSIGKGVSICARTRAIVIASAWGLVASATAAIALQGPLLASTVGLGFTDVLSAGFAVAALIKIACAIVLITLFYLLRDRVPSALLIAVAAVEIAAATLTTHAIARLDHRPLLAMAAALHQIGAAIWIGGLPCFVMALARVHDGARWRQIGQRYSQMSVAGVVLIFISGILMSMFYIGDLQGFYGTAYGAMVGAKIAMFAALLALGAMNNRLIERLRAAPETPVIRLKRFAEVEIGIGFTLFFAAASLTSVPPAVDLTTDRVTWHEIVERFEPHWPRLTSPDRESLAIPALQAELDREAAQRQSRARSAFEPGAGYLPPRNAADIAWSEYNHHWAGIAVLLIGSLALLNQAGVRAARHWPLLFLLLALFLFLRSDPEVWPLGQIGFWESLRDTEVIQHRIFVVLITVFGLFEWRVRTGRLGSTRAALVFPLASALGGALLLTHSHAISNLKDQLLIELSHIPLALAGIAAGWARWLELRLEPPLARIAGWVWPPCFMLAGLILLLYREV